MSTERDITFLLGIASVLRPDLIERFPHAVLRREAAALLAEERAKADADSVPPAFRDAFADDR